MFESNPILKPMSNWYKRTFADPAAVTLFLTVVFGFLILYFFGQLLLPVLVSIVIAYLLNSVVRLLDSWKCPHVISVVIALLLLIGLIAYVLIAFIPTLTKQLSNLLSEIPLAVRGSEAWLQSMSVKYPKIFSMTHYQHLATYLQDESTKLGQFALRYSLASIPSIIQLILYLVLVPLLVFFFLKDSAKIKAWFASYLSNEPGLIVRVCSEVRTKIGAYVKGRVVEIIIVGAVSSITFSLLGLQYAVLLGVLVGLSVIIPYVGAIAVTIPVVIISLMEWGFSAHFFYLILAYALIIILDANVLVPLLFSGAMDLHPVVIILSVIIFGGIWGFWGVFFAIPLAMLFHVILKAWPRAEPVGNGE